MYQLDRKSSHAGFNSISAAPKVSDLGLRLEANRCGYDGLGFRVWLQYNKNCFCQTPKPHILRARAHISINGPALPWCRVLAIQGLGVQDDQAVVKQVD